MLAFPLQMGIPGGPELLIILLISLVLVAVPTYLVYRDAKRRQNDNAALWGVATLLGGLVGNLLGALLVVVIYLIAGRD